MLEKALEVVVLLWVLEEALEVLVLLSVLEEALEVLVMLGMLEEALQVLLLPLDVLELVWLEDMSWLHLPFVVSAWAPRGYCL